MQETSDVHIFQTGGPGGLTFAFHLPATRGFAVWKHVEIEISFKLQYAGFFLQKVKGRYMIHDIYIYIHTYIHTYIYIYT